MSGVITKVVRLHC